VEKKSKKVEKILKNSKKLKKIRKKFEKSKKTKILGLPGFDDLKALYWLIGGFETHD
jgi:hypothetical protein